MACLKVDPGVEKPALRQLFMRERERVQEVRERMLVLGWEM